jgi:phospholipase/lecithinase/hemolysin
MYDYYKDKIEFAQKQFKIFNTIIEDSVIQYNSNQNNIRVDLFDADYEITEISKKFEDITTPYKNSKYYPKQGKWFWFDQWHFMTETHKYIAEQIYLSL